MKILRQLGKGRYLIEGTSGYYYVDGEFCTCPSFMFRKNICKHVREMRKMPVELEELEKNMKQFPSFIGGLNELFGGYVYSSDALVGIHGKPQSGKSLWMVHESFNLASKGETVLYVDTEGNIKSMMFLWKEVLKKKFGELKGKIYIESLRTLESLNRYFGFETSVKFVQASKKEDKGKLEFRIVSTIEEPELDKTIKKNEISFVILDSVSAPIRETFTEEQQNFPARASAMGLLFGKLLNVQENYGCGAVVTNHTSMNPQNPYQKFGTMRGGIVPHHFIKRCFYIDQRDASELWNYRRIWVARAENLEKFSAVVGVKISNEGIDEVEDISKLLTDAEFKYLASGE